MAVYENVLQTIGSTPVIKLNRMGRKDVDIYVKVESFNPMGSVKDRLAVAWTDFLQGWLMLIALVVLPLVAMTQLGGWGEVTEKVGPALKARWVHLEPSDDQAPSL